MARTQARGQHSRRRGGKQDRCRNSRWPYVHPEGTGGTSTLLVGFDRQLREHRISLAGTLDNCAGGPTPWQTRLSCEEKHRHLGQDSESARADHVRSISIPTLIVSGDRDVPTTEHAVELSRLFPDARLMILPGEHGAFLGELLGVDRGTCYPELSAQLIGNFLEGRY